MSEVTWQHRSGRRLAAIGIAVAWCVVSATSVSSRSSPPRDGSACGDALPARSSGAWFRRVADEDRHGWLRGYTLHIGRADGARTARVRLPAASFVAPPVHGFVAYGSDDGRRSSVRIARAADGCDRHVMDSSAVVRGGTLAPGADALYVHLVDRGTRADLGIWRQALDAGGRLRRVMPGLADPADGPFGRTFLTLFTWSGSGRTLAVQSCGEIECRTRLLDTTTGRWTLDARRGQGELIGLSDRERYGYAACHGLPCRVVGTDASGRRRSLVRAAGVAAFADGGVWYESPAGDGTVELRHVDAGRRGDRAVRAVTGRRLAWPARWADAAVEAPLGWVVLTDDGTWSRPSDVSVARFDDDATVRLVAQPEIAR